MESKSKNHFLHLGDIEKHCAAVNVLMVLLLIISMVLFADYVL